MIRLVVVYTIITYREAEGHLSCSFLDLVHRQIAELQLVLYISEVVLRRKIFRCLIRTNLLIIYHRFEEF